MYDSDEKNVALQNVELLREQGQGADENDLAAVLALVPDAEPEKRDRFPSPSSLSAATTCSYNLRGLILCCKRALKISDLL